MSILITTFLSAFLLFQVQPILGRYILPWFGGTPGVWTTCMVFFQVSLVLGYGYAHALSNLVGRRAQPLVHLVLLGCSLLLLPITPSDTWKPTNEESPALRILGLLTLSVGVPYFLLATTGPLLQRWYSWRFPAATPYRLYALSNVGSLLGLLAYPFVVEPKLPLAQQTYWWSAGFMLFVACCGWSALAMLLSASPEESTQASPSIYQLDHSTEGVLPSSTSQSQDVSHGITMRPTFTHYVFWLLLPTCSSVLLLAVTNHICQDIAVVPFLWIAPLSLYLISFIICFDRPRWYGRGWWGGALVLLLLLVGGVMYVGPDLPMVIQIFYFSLLLFVACMVCHGELVRLVPSARYLTAYYLLISTGGAFGGLFVGLAAPALFNYYWELHLSLLLLAALLLVIHYMDGNSPLYHFQMPAAWAILIAAWLLLAYNLNADISRRNRNVIAATRNFYGSLRVVDQYPDTPSHWRELTHGRIRHGLQYQIAPFRHAKTTYYGPMSGAGLALRLHPQRGEGLRIGVTGLGAGSLAVYAGPKDELTFFEINPIIEEIAREYFSYLADSLAKKIDVVLGDGRIALERAIQSGHSYQFDVLILDAFSSDAVPVHLLTSEAFEIYHQHLKPDGILVVHISNRYLDLGPVVRGLAEQRGAEAHLVVGSEIPNQGIIQTTYVLVTTNKKFLEHPQFQRETSAWPNERRLIWNDDFSNLFLVLKQ